MFTMALSEGGRGLARFARRVQRNTDQASYRAVNHAGRWARTRIRRALAKLLNIKLSTLKAIEIERPANRRYKNYRVKWLRREFKPGQLKGTRFAKLKRKGDRLTLKAYGKKQQFEIVHVEGQGEDATYYVARTNYRPRQRRLRRVRGSVLKRDYREPAEIKGNVRRIMLAEFRRQMKLNRRRGR